MTRQKRASPATDLTNPELSDDNVLAFSPTAQKRLKRNKKRHEAGDGWLWRPSGPKMPSPNASPIPLRFDRPSPPRSKSTSKKKKSKTKQKTKKLKDLSREVNGFHSSPPAITPHSGTVMIGSNEHGSDEEGQVSVRSNIDNIGHTPGPGAKMKKAPDTSTTDPNVSSDRLKTKEITPNSTEDPRAFSARLKAIEDKADKSDRDLRNEIAGLRESIRLLEERTQRNEMRAAIRHDIIFDVIKKISHDVNRIRRNSNDLLSSSESISGGSSEVGSDSSPPKNKTKRSRSPGPQKAAKKAEQEAANRRTMERLVSQYTEDLNSASSLEAVKESGELCKKYAGDLINKYM